MNRLTDNDKNFGPFTFAKWNNTFQLMYRSGGGEEQERKNSILIAGFGYALRIMLPFILKPWKEHHISSLPNPDGGKPYEYDIFWEREYGVALSNMGNGYDFLQVHFGAQTHDSRTTEDWCCHLPWKQSTMVRHSLYDPEGNHIFSGLKFDDYWKALQECPKCHFGFEDYDGEMIIASCHIEEREWHKGTGWFKWLKYFSKPHIRRSLDIEFDHEVGPEKGSWKGGTTGHGIDMQPGETPEHAFRRYCQKEHNARHGRTYRLRFIGKSKPPEPREIRVARARGWKQCDYPHESAKDMWHHPDHPICSDGKYISTEEMLESIQEENRKQNEQCGMMLKAS